MAYSYPSSGQPRPHAVTQVGSTTYAYDANGSMVQRGSQTIKYDPQRHPVRLDSGGTTVWRTAYDGDGVRRKRLDQSGTIHYLGAYERNVGNGLDTTEVVTKYYGTTLGNVTRLIAFRKDGTLFWMGTDHLGSTTRVADASFNALDGMRYTPYGVSRDPGSALNTDHRFTSQVEDASIGLYWYGSRAYDQALGRFVAPDTIVPEPGNPQAMNRYSYALNNPLRFTDPSGHVPSTDMFDNWKASFYSDRGRWPNEHEIQDWYLAAEGVDDDTRDDILNTPWRFPADFGALLGAVIETVLLGKWAHMRIQRDYLQRHPRTATAEMPYYADGEWGWVDLVDTRPPDVIFWEIKPNTDSGKEDGRKALDKRERHLKAFFASLMLNFERGWDYDPRTLTEQVGVLTVTIRAWQHRRGLIVYDLSVDVDPGVVMQTLLGLAATLLTRERLAWPERRPRRV
ncbi:MAG: RHS repeat-associated core domain-containing protein [Chloroflexi bacterium]|nr:RHS repeat-associated core domain-containing protein [Chloroflexota bacterium]